MVALFLFDKNFKSEYCEKNTEQLNKAPSHEHREKLLEIS